MDTLSSSSRRSNERVMKKVFVFADYSQAESRIVAWRGPVPKLKLWFQQKKDVHIEVAKIIAKVIQENKIKLPNNLFTKKKWYELDKSDKDERQVGKTTGHANNYGLGKDTFAFRLGLPVEHAAVIQAIYHTQLPEIKGGYQAWIRRQIDTKHCLTLPQGWTKFFYDIPGDPLYRAAYAFYPQSTVGLLLTACICGVCEIFEKVKFDGGIVWTPQRLRQCGLDFRLNAHDAIGVVVPDDKECIDFAIKTIRENGEKPLLIGDDELTIPMDFKIGSSWGELYDP